MIAHVLSSDRLNPVRILHEHFCCNRGFAAATRLSARRARRQSLTVLFQVRFDSSGLRLQDTATSPLGGVHKLATPYSARRGPHYATEAYHPSSPGVLETPLPDFATNRHGQCGLVILTHACGRLLLRCIDCAIQLVQFTACRVTRTC